MNFHTSTTLPRDLLTESRIKMLLKLHYRSQVIDKKYRVRVCSNCYVIILQQPIHHYNAMVLSSCEVHPETRRVRLTTASF